MKLTRAYGTLGLVVLAGAISPPAMAEDAGWYIGASVGQSRATIDNDRIISGLLGGGFATTDISDDDRDTGFKLLGGYQFNRYFALEGGYFDLGKFGFTATTLPAGTLNGTIKVKGLDLDAVGLYPFTEKFSALGRIGVISASAKDSFDGTGLVFVPDPDRSKRAMNYKIGVGLQYDFTHNFGMRTEAERYRINDAVGNRGDIDLFSLGVIYRFGEKKQDVATAAAAPPPAEPVAPAVAEEPVLVIVPIAAKTQQYCSILDIQFEINQDDIQREEKERLGVVGTFMTKYPDTTAVIEGHADSVGSDDHNMKLSQRRAESVVSYLEETYKISPDRLKAVGYGDTRPVADNGTEAGKRLNRRIDAVIACAKDIEGLKVAKARVTMALEMEFDYKTSAVKSVYREDLRKVANFLKANPGVTATVEGHTGNLQGTSDKAMEMSHRRAQNVVEYLVDNFGVDRSRLSAEGFGQTRRFAYNTTLEGQQENRRVNIIFNYPEK